MYLEVRTLSLMSQELPSMSEVPLPEADHGFTAFFYRQLPSQISECKNASSLTASGIAEKRRQSRVVERISGLPSKRKAWRY